MVQPTKDYNQEIRTAKETFNCMADKFSAVAFCEKFRKLYGKPVMETTIMRRLRDINADGEAYKYEGKLYHKKSKSFSIAA